MDRIRRMAATIAGITSAMAIRIAMVAIVVIAAVILSIFGRNTERPAPSRTPPSGPTNSYTEQPNVRSTKTAPRPPPLAEPTSRGATPPTRPRWTATLTASPAR
jgi:hypothetical protein